MIVSFESTVKLTSHSSLNGIKMDLPPADKGVTRRGVPQSRIKLSPLSPTQELANFSNPPVVAQLQKIKVRSIRYFIPKRIEQESVNA